MAAICSISSATFKSWEIQIQWYVDDPATTVRGSLAMGKELIGRLLFLWAFFGMPIAWGKGRHGMSVRWIGAGFILKSTYPAKSMDHVLGVVTASQVSKMKELQGLSAKWMIEVKKVRRAPSLLSWVGSLFPWTRAFTARLWAAFTAHVMEQSGLTDRRNDGKPQRKRPTHLFFSKRIQSARWVGFLIAGMLRDSKGKPMPIETWRSVSL